MSETEKPERKSFHVHGMNRSVYTTLKYLAVVKRMKMADLLEYLVLHALDDEALIHEYPQLLYSKDALKGEK